MLSKEYQDYIMTIIKVAGAQVKAKGKFKSSSVLKHKLTKAAAAKSYALTLSRAAHKKKETAKFMNAEMAKMTLSAFKKTHKAAKKQGLVLLPAAAIAAPVIAQAPKMPQMPRREFFVGAVAIAAFGSIVMTPATAQAGDTAYWGAVKKQVKAFLGTSQKAMLAAMT